MAAKLAGVTIVVTRAAHQAEELAAPLRAQGANLIVLPLIGIGPPRDPRPLRQAIRLVGEHVDQYDWIVFTSANAVDAFAAALGGHGTLRARIAAVGSATREAAEAHGFQVALTPQRYVAESLAEAFASVQLAGSRVLIPRAEIARDVVPEELRKRGAQVDVVDAYRNLIPTGAAAGVAAIFRDPLPDWVLFASSSAVDHLAALCDLAILHRLRIGTIGPVTSATVRKLGLTVHAEAHPHTVEGLVAAVISAHMGSLQTD